MGPPRSRPRLRRHRSDEQRAGAHDLRGEFARVFGLHGDVLDREAIGEAN
jgi:hypothetical protein